MEDFNSDDEVFETKEIKINNIEDISSFNQNYEKMKKSYKSRPFLNKYQKTQVISERSQQLANGAIPLIKNLETYNNVYEIAQEELRQNKTYGKFGKIPDSKIFLLDLNNTLFLRAIYSNILKSNSFSAIKLVRFSDN